MIFTMLFSGGLIPYYLTVSSLFDDSLLAIIVPCVVIILIEALKIANIFMAEKKKWRQEEEERKDNELEELRRRVAELEGERNKQAVDKEDKTE